MKKNPRPTYSFFALSSKDRSAKLKEIVQKFKDEPQTRRKLAQRLAQAEHLKSLRIVPAQRGSPSLMEEMTLGTRVDFDDDWWRVVLVTKRGTVEIWNGERFASHDVKRSSRVFRESMTLKTWPRGTLGKSNPWKDPYICDAGLVLIKWSEEHQQYYFFLPHRENKDIGTTWWFPPRYQKSERGDEWKHTRYASKSVPWVAGPVVRKKRKVNLKLTKDEKTLLYVGGMANLTKVIISIRERYAKNLEDGTVTAIAVKDFAEQEMELLTETTKRF